MKITPPVTWAPWKPVSVKKTPAKTPSFGRNPRRVYSYAWPERNITPSTTVGTSQRISLRRSPFLIALTASCIVTLDATSSIVFTSGRPCQLGFSPKTGSHTGILPRRKRYVVKRAAKNMTSLPTNKMIPHIPLLNRVGCTS